MRTSTGSLSAMLALALATTAIVSSVGRSADRGSDGTKLLDPAYVAQGICKPIPARRTELYKPGFQLAQAAATRTADRITDAGPQLFENLGSLSYPVTTTSELAQRYFDQGLRLAFAFNHAEAARAFKAAQAADPACAMCYWGEAYALGPNINYPMMPEAVAPAFAAIAQAMALREGAAAHERALIEAMARRYAADPEADRKAMNAAYADAMAEVAVRFPEDDQVQVLLADALMNLQPWDYWAPDKRTPKGRTAEQVAALERVLHRNPDHPGAIHLYIHTVEASATPERAEPYADRLGGLMPGAGHLVHMPSHIYYRVGRYLDSLEANLKAAKADEAYLAQAEASGIYPYGYYPHNVHFVLASATMAGDGANAVMAAEKLGQVMSDEVAREVGWVEAIKQAPYFAHAQFSQPATVLALPAPAEDFPFIRASWHYARAMAYLRAANPTGAAAEGKQLADLAAGADFARLVAWGVPAGDVLAIAQKLVEGRVAQADGRMEEAIALFREAAAIQDGLPYMEPPFWYYPVRQTLGAALLQAGRADDAAEAFQAALMATPNSAFSLFGLMKAQEAQGDTAGMAATKARFEQAWAGGSRMPKLGEL